ncbi:TPA: response regulator transcription factor, partial [Enterococcus faecium]|nr:response regulator transcription factor [Enterococcus faecium]HAP9092776.1 response regulator transcription factor [Enterococcus faecium]
CTTHQSLLTKSQNIIKTIRGVGYRLEES